MAFALQKSAVAQKAAVCQSRASVRVCAVKGESSSNVQQASALAAFAAAALLTAHPASAGVILEQPKLKQALVDTSPAAPAAKREIILPGMRSKQAPKVAGAAKQAAPKKAPAPSVQGGDLDPRAIALPGSLALIAGGTYALTKVDEGFADFMTEASCKDSGADGAGYETAIKGGALAIKPKSKPSSKAGTKKGAGASRPGTGFSLPGGLGGLLNKE